MPTRLILELDDHGRLNVSGPIKNKILCLGMFELGKEAICDFHKAQAEQQVQEASPADVQALGGLKAD